MRFISRLIIHHSASGIDTTAAQVKGWHLDKGWSDIGYHYVVEGSGLVVIGRDLDRAGAHAKGANGDSVGICLVGSNNVPSERWTFAQIESANELIGALRRVLGGEITVHGHCDVGITATLCPGVDVNDVFNV